MTWIAVVLLAQTGLCVSGPQLYNVVFDSSFTYPQSGPDAQFPGFYQSLVFMTSSNANFHMYSLSSGTPLTSSVANYVSITGDGNPVGYANAVVNSFTSSQTTGFVGLSLNPSPNSVQFSVTMQAAQPYVSMIARIAFSPDFFVGVDAINLQSADGSQWLETLQIPLYGIDGGTYYSDVSYDPEGGVVYHNEFLNPPIYFQHSTPFPPVLSSNSLLLLDNVYTQVGTLNFFRSDVPPIVQSVAPASGRQDGGTIITVTGANFGPTLNINTIPPTRAVMIGSYPCPIVYFDGVPQIGTFYIECTTPTRSTTGITTLPVTVLINNVSSTTSAPFLFSNSPNTMSTGGAATASVRFVMVIACILVALMFATV